MQYKKRFIYIKNIAIKICLALFFYILFDLLVGSWYLTRVGDQPFKTRVVKEKRENNIVGSSIFHHGLVPNTTTEYEWAGNIYPIFVNSLGLVDREIRQVDINNDKYRILFIGDSFVEGIGYEYDETAVGIIDRALRGNGVEVLNLGLRSYSPKMYYLKTKYFLENFGLRANEAFIFIDLSDMYNEIRYVDHNPDDNVLGDAIEPMTVVSFSARERVCGFFSDHSLLLGAIRMYKRLIEKPDPYMVQDYSRVIENWTLDRELFNAFGRRGLELSSQNMSKLISLLRKHSINNITIVVYPWPEQIKQRDDNSVQVKYWEAFAKTHDVNFINLFPKFFIPNAEKVLFMQDGEHWNRNGHELVAKEVLGVMSKRGFLSR